MRARTERCLSKIAHSGTLFADGKKVAEGALPLLAQLGPSAMSAIRSLLGCKADIEQAASKMLDL